MTGREPGGGPAGPWPDGFRDLYEARWVPMIRLAHVLTGGDPAAEEVVQDAFLRVGARFDRIEHPTAYLRAAVVNGCLSHGRRRARERRATAASSLGAGETRDRPDELRDSVVRLPARQRAAVALRYYEDLAERDVAVALGCSVPAVKSLLHRALETLREEIER